MPVIKYKVHLLSTAVYSAYIYSTLWTSCLLSLTIMYTYTALTWRQQELLLHSSKIIKSTSTSKYSTAESMDSVVYMHGVPITAQRG